jgi:hypothetical protein
MREGPRSAILLLGMGCAALAAGAQTPAPQVSVTVIVVNANSQPPQPVKAVRVSLQYLDSGVKITEARQVTNPQGRAPLVVSADAARHGRLRVQIDGATDLTIYLPADGQLPDYQPAVVPATVEIDLLPKGTAKLLDEPGLTEALLHRMSREIARQQKQIKALQSQANAGTGQEPGQSEKPDLGAALDEWAKTNDFSSEQVQKMVQKWADDIERKGGAATEEEHGFAESALKHYDSAAQYFGQASEADQQEADTIADQVQAEKDRAKALEDQLKTAKATGQALHDKWLSSLEKKLEHSEDQADAFQSGDKYHEATQALESTAAALAADYEKDTGDRDLHELWLNAVSDVGDALDKEEEQAEDEEGDGKIPYGSQTTVLLGQLEEKCELLAREHLALGDSDLAASAEDKLADVLSQAGEYVSEDKALALVDQVITAYSKALEDYTKSGNTDESVRAQMNLAATWMQKGQIEGGQQRTASFHEAVQGYQKVVDACVKDRSPNCDSLKPEIALGQALKEEGQPAAADKALGLLDQAAQTYKEELDTYRDQLQAYGRAHGYQDLTTLQQWAQTEWRLGDTLAKEASFAANDKALPLFDQAVQAFQHAHEYYNKASAYKRETADLEADRGKTLRIESMHTNGDRATTLLDQAVQAYRNVLACYSKADQPGDWAEAQLNFGITLWLEAEYVGGDKATALLDQAGQAFRSALEVYTKTAPPSELAPVVELGLGMALSNEGIRAGDDKSSALLDQAVQTLKNALQVLSRSESPDGWADLQLALGEALANKALRGEGSQASALFDQAIQAFRNALQVSGATGSLSDQTLKQVGLANVDLVAGRFGACLEQARSIPGDSSDPDAAVIRDSVKLACEWGAGDKSAALATAKAIQPMTAAQSGTLWTGAWNFPAAFYFLSHSPSFAAGRPSWIALFAAVHDGDSAGITAALHQLEPILQQ